VTIRAVTPPLVRLADPDADAAGVTAVYRPAVEATVATFEEVAPAPEEMADRMRGILGRTPWLVAADEAGAITGYAYASPHRERAGYRWSVDISVYVDPAHQGRGIGRALYDVLLDLLRRQRYLNVFAGIALPNEPSVSLHRAVGMATIGVYPQVGWKHGRWVDVAWFGMRLADPDEPPAEPIPLPLLDGA
jgi:L-amino acid N-acyltransferase YncA